MKGRRKAKQLKWSLRAQFEVDASQIMAKRSQIAAHRFLDAALVFGKDFEPTGRLAGDLYTHGRCTSRGSPKA